LGKTCRFSQAQHKEGEKVSTQWPVFVFKKVAIRKRGRWKEGDAHRIRSSRNGGLPGNGTGKEKISRTTQWGGTPVEPKRSGGGEEYAKPGEEKASRCH